MSIFKYYSVIIVHSSPGKATEAPDVSLRSGESVNGCPKTTVDALKALITFAPGRRVIRICVNPLATRNQ
jgi:hypothetical protein